MPNAFIYLFPIFFSILGAMVFLIDSMGRKRVPVRILLADLFVHSFSGAIVGSLLLFNGLALPLACILSALSGFFGRHMLGILRQILVFATLRGLNVTPKEINDVVEDKNEDDKVKKLE